MVVDLHQVGLLTEDRPRDGVRLRARCRQHAGKLLGYIAQPKTLSMLPTADCAPYPLQHLRLLHRQLGSQHLGQSIDLVVLNTCKHTRGVP